MGSREKEYKEIFIAEALEVYHGLSGHIIELEKNTTDDKILAEIFRLLHNLKANAKAIGYVDIAEIAHKLENVFGAIRDKNLSFQGNVVTLMLDGIDLLGTLIANIDNPKFEGPETELLKNIDSLLDDLSAGQAESSPIKKYYTSQNISLSDLIYIPIRKLDDLMNLVGELIIDKDRILSLGNEIGMDALKNVSSHLHRITSEIQNTVMDARLVNVGSLFTKFPRIVRDVALIDDKSVELEITGQDIKIDRNILQIITDAMLHLVRNAVTHGIEPKEEREKAGKDPVGKIDLSAQSDKDQVLIIIKDDGRGIDLEKVRKNAIINNFITTDKAKELSDSEIISLIFEPGFSLSKTVTELSGRGVGLDVVKNALDSIGGKIKIESKIGEGTAFKLYLPTSIAVKGALLFEVDSTSYAIPLIHTDSVLTIYNKELHQVGPSMVADIKTETLPIICLKEFFDSDNTTPHYGKVDDLKGEVQNVIVVSYNNRKLGLIVDRLLRQQDIVVKPLQKPLDNIDYFGGVTLLGTGEVCLVVDVPSISKQLSVKSYI
jgi:two-component system, chemotaxis family, sensor kinase CheA